jgi:hypothetical protein
LRDLIKNSIEVIDESGTVEEVIDIPNEIEGKRTMEMDMWVDDEGVGLGERYLKGGNLKIRKLNNNKSINWSNEKEESIFHAKVSTKKFNLDIRTTKELAIINTIGVDEYNNQFIEVDTQEKISERSWKWWDKIIKISQDGKLLAVFEINKYWFSDEWKAGCKSISPLIDNLEVSTKIQKNGDIYLLQYICCKEQDCYGKIRIIKISSKKGTK